MGRNSSNIILARRVINPADRTAGATESGGIAATEGRIIFGTRTALLDVSPDREMITTVMPQSTATFKLRSASASPDGVLTGVRCCFIMLGLFDVPVEQTRKQTQLDESSRIGERGLRATITCAAASLQYDGGGFGFFHQSSKLPDIGGIQATVGSGTITGLNVLRSAVAKLLNILIDGDTPHNTCALTYGVANLGNNAAGQRVRRMDVGQLFCDNIAAHEMLCSTNVLRSGTVAGQKVSLPDHIDKWPSLTLLETKDSL